MTKKELAKQILETIELEGCGAKSIPSIMALLDTLEPKDREQFAKWGFPEQQSTPEQCWL